MKPLKLKVCNVLESSNTFWSDVDDTLVVWDVDHTSDREIISVKCPHMNKMIQLHPHRTHINILKRNFYQGRTVIVWSAAGFAWAKAVVEALGLEEYVTLIIEKPALIMDDVDMKDWEPKRIFLSRDIEGRKQ